jgi:hypothetical protein
MATRGLISPLLVGICLAFLLLAYCSSFPRKSFTRGQQDLAGIPGIADARIWADDPTGLSRAALFSYGQHKPASIDVLALSGGGAEGAFGAGLLVGWTEAGNRPEFSMVSGTSSGALIAPFAFLGSSHDPILKGLFTSGIAETLLRVDGLNAIFGSGVARSFYSSVKANTRNTLIATYDFARRNGWRFRLAAIPPDYAMTSTTFNFATDYMRRLFDLGFSMGRTGQQWQSSLKAFAGSSATGHF